MASSTLELYEALASAPDDKTRAKLIAEAFERLAERYPHLPNLVTQSHLTETELRLQKEIEQLRGEVRTDIERMKNELLKWLIPLMFAQVAVIAALVKLL
jgi:hypothetical protein